ncbi:hypothetical protein AVI51_11185 [Piscirickettsia salmonis]|uniref:Glycosyl transferase n=1 Tax=Piscirickettsia salmonis TaxID=1238 RepID=A0A9Q5YM02_PISSA|nr:glycosyltransferase family 2 protein [Piscirickettsia salmonis]ALA26424.1 glycosyl transferase 2 family protein [Piscirickettsia salmonis]APS43849.1 hypothetical protein AVI48_05315 [Piscirickettsia salmonis]APS47203.1 hypothetical protein AVI49_05915 [Piscirickettsia salmonis]APS51357.1 hypothetical protein AVI50_11300 [Piscirickettsia salmonis]APS54566.1 hypothetical protein AVI51_11185 [Piscirickettsia salmonis]
MQFSLILATISRVNEVDHMLTSLQKQSYQNFEVIVVDQNLDNRLDLILAKHQLQMNIHHVKVEKPGLSRARNVGLAQASGDIIAFPDDDCFYHSDTLSRVKDFFQKNKNYNIYSCRLLDPDSNDSSCNRWLTTDSDFSLTNVFRCALSATLFIKLNKKKDVNFDERFGVGGEFGSSEETDMLINLMYLGYIGRYHVNGHIYHPDKKPELDRAHIYGQGLGAMLKKQIYYYKRYKLIKNVILSLILKPLIAIFINVLRLNIKMTKFYSKLFFSRWLGFFKYKSVK